MSKKINNLQEHFGIDTSTLARVLERLSEKNLEVLHRIFGSDLINGKRRSDITKEDQIYLLTTIMPKLKRIIDELSVKRESSIAKSQEEFNVHRGVVCPSCGVIAAINAIECDNCGSILPKRVRRTNEQESLEPIKEVNSVMSDVNYGIDPNEIDSSVSETEKPLIQEEIIKPEKKLSDPKLITDGIIRLFHDPFFTPILKEMPTKRFIVVAMYLGYVNNQRISANDIARIFSLDISDVNENIKEGLIDLKNHFTLEVDKELSGKGYCVKHE